jgi:SAM-dependent methyltransferase
MLCASGVPPLSSATQPYVMMPPDREPLFDVPSEYDALLHQGIRLSGEDREFFARGRVADLVGQLPETFRPRRVLDFGCGRGDTARLLGESFPTAEVVGIDSSDAAIAWAREHHGSERITFDGPAAMEAHAPFDLCHLSGVLHHVLPAERVALLGALRNALAPGGQLALFENNPWNPGTRLVMRRIPFDRDAVPLSPPETRRLVERVGLRVQGTRFLFYFPRPLAVLRPLEGWLALVPLGAQYWVLSERRSD